MKEQEKRDNFIILRANGYSYNQIAAQLSISKSTCSAWQKELGGHILDLKREQLTELYKKYGMRREARIEQLGEIMARIDTALEDKPLEELPADKLLAYKLKYMNLLKIETIGITPEAEDEQELLMISINKNSNYPF